MNDDYDFGWTKWIPWTITLYLIGSAALKGLFFPAPEVVFCPNYHECYPEVSYWSHEFDSVILHNKVDWDAYNSKVHPIEPF